MLYNNYTYNYLYKINEYWPGKLRANFHHIGQELSCCGVLLWDIDKNLIQLNSEHTMAIVYCVQAL